MDLEGKWKKPGRKRQIPCDFPYMRNLTKQMNTTARDSLTERGDWWFPWGRGRGGQVR